MTRLMCVVFLFVFIEKILCEAENGTHATYDVIVVGLGASGVSALSVLARAGRRVLGLEAADRIGGRVYTVNFGTGVVEVGAEWIHGENTSVPYALAVENRVPIRKDASSFDLRRSDGSRLDENIAENLMNFIIDLLERRSKGSETMGTYFTRKFLEHIKTIPSLANDTDFINEFLAFSNGQVNFFEASNDWNDVPTASNFEVLAGHQSWSWHTLGYKTLFDILLNKYNNGTGVPADIKLNKEVTSIQWTKDTASKVILKCKDETSYTADSVIVTFSLGVLKERYSTLFNPQLPEDKINAINALTIGVVDKIILLYDSAWWPKDVVFSGFIWKGEDRAKISEEDAWITRIVGFTVPLGSENCLTLWLSGETAKLVESLPDDVVLKKCTEILRKFVGLQVPEPKKMIRSTWYSNPFTRGSYTFDSANMTDSSSARATLAAPLVDDASKPKLLFAGEATNQKHFSTVHGAVETGIREAQRVLNCFNNSRNENQ